LLRKFGLDRPGLERGPLIGRKIDNERYTFGIPIPLGDPDLLRAVAKVALCYAREVGCDVSFDSVAARFLRGSYDGMPPVASPQNEVIELPDLTTPALTHGVYLHEDVATRQLFAYVVLFEIVELVVLLDEGTSFGVAPNGYRYNLVTGQRENRRFRWVADPASIGEWLRVPQVISTRLTDRSPALMHYIGHPEDLWTARAMAAAARAFFEERDSGREGTAQQVARQRAEKMLQRYGLRLGELRIGLQEPGTGGPGTGTPAP
jgi:hypothetical protein